MVLSRRAYLEEAQRSQRDEFLTNLKPGEVRKGVVSSVVNFGAFVDLGGMDGLIHVSELSWKHVDHPGQIVQVGDQVTVRVLDVDLDRERISLSLKATQADPWQEFANAHRVGELVYGRVTKLVPFGAFVQVGDGIEGLVHISEMAVHHVDQPDQVVTPGEELWVKIIDIDLARRRISLSIKQAAEGGEVAAEYREAFGEHAYDEHGNYIGATEYTAFEPESEAQAAWAGYLAEQAQQEASGTASAAGATDEHAGSVAGAGPATAAPVEDRAVGTARPEAVPTPAAAASAPPAAASAPAVAASASGAAASASTGVAEPEREARAEVGDRPEVVAEGGAAVHSAGAEPEPAEEGVAEVQAEAEPRTVAEAVSPLGTDAEPEEATEATPER